MVCIYILHVTNKFVTANLFPLEIMKYLTEIHKIEILMMMGYEDN